MPGTLIPLFPLRSVLCPGIALPLHIFEDRYRLMVGRCIEAGDSFGVVLIREGREVGPVAGQVASVGTTAAIRQAGRYPDGRLDIVTVGQRRFRIQDLDASSEPYLVGHVSYLKEPLGGDDDATAGLARRVGERFLRYLELLQAGLADLSAQQDDEVDGPTAALASNPLKSWLAPASDDINATDDLDVMGSTDGADRVGDEVDVRRRAAQLLASASRLVTSGDATAISYLLTGLVQLDLGVRQDLLEVPDTSSRLLRVDALLHREMQLIGRNLRPLAVDLRTLDLRRN